MAYIYKGILFRYNKEWDPVTLNSMGGPCRHMSGGLSQTNKDKCPMISLICGIEKQKKTTPTPQADRYGEQTGGCKGRRWGRKTWGKGVKRQKGKYLTVELFEAQ